MNCSKKSKIIIVNYLVTIQCAITINEHMLLMELWSVAKVLCRVNFMLTVANITYVKITHNCHEDTSSSSEPSDNHSCRFLFLSSFISHFQLSGYLFSHLPSWAVLTGFKRKKIKAMKQDVLVDCQIPSHRHQGSPNSFFVIDLVCEHGNRKILRLLLGYQSLKLLGEWCRQLLMKLSWKLGELVCINHKCQVNFILSFINQHFIPGQPIQDINVIQTLTNNGCGEKTRDYNCYSFGAYCWITFSPPQVDPSN